MEISETVADEYLRPALTELLAQCTEPQRATFARCYPDGVPAERLTLAIALCKRTIKKNLKPNN